MRFLLRHAALLSALALISLSHAQLVTPPTIDWVSLPSTATVGQTVSVGVGAHANLSDNSDSNDWNTGQAVVARVMIDLDGPSGTTRIYDWLPTGETPAEVWTSFNVTAPGTHYISVRLMDGRPWFSDTLNYSIGVPTPAPSITSQLSASVNQGYTVSYTITASNSPTSFNATNLPSGLSVNTSTGVISGRILDWTSTVNSTITATSSAGSDSKTLVWTITGAVITPSSSVSPTTVTLGNAMTLTRSGSANFGIAWTENTIWKPNGSAEVLGNMGLGSQSFTPTMVGNYSYQVRIVDNSAYNYTDQWISFTVTSLAAPTGLGSTSTGSYSVALGWNAVTGAAQYHIYKNGSYLGSTTGTTFNVTGLNPSTSYSFTVQAQDSGSNYSAQTSALNVTTAASFELFTPL